MAGLGDMGNSDAGLYSGVTFTSGNSTTLGSILGIARQTLAQPNLPNVAPTIDASTAVWNTMAYSTAATQAGSSSGFSYVNSIVTGGAGGGSVTQVNSRAGLASGAITASSINGNVAQTAFTTVSPFILTTIYIKL
jgi:hypothetical protein